MFAWYNKEMLKITYEKVTLSILFAKHFYFLSRENLISNDDKISGSRLG